MARALRGAAAAALTVAALLCEAIIATGQEPAPPAPHRPAILAAARELMGRARYCTLVTVGPEGHPQARIVDPLAPEGDDMTVWIATNPLTRKVDQIRKDPRVTLLYFHSGGPGYVTLLGTAEVVSDAAEKAKRWKEEWAPFYKDKSRGDDYVLLRVKPSRLEIVSEAQGMRSDPQTWRPLSVAFE
jgi:general stress protein 26